MDPQEDQLQVEQEDATSTTVSDEKVNENKQGESVEEIVKNSNEKTHTETQPSEKIQDVSDSQDQQQSTKEMVIPSEVNEDTLESQQCKKEEDIETKSQQHQDEKESQINEVDQGSENSEQEKAQEDLLEATHIQALEADKIQLEYLLKGLLEDNRAKSHEIQRLKKDLEEEKRARSIIQNEHENCIAALNQQEIRYENEVKESGERFKKFQSDILARFKSELIRFQDQINDKDVEISEMKQAFEVKLHEYISKEMDYKRLLLEKERQIEDFKDQITEPIDNINMVVNIIQSYKQTLGRYEVEVSHLVKEKVSEEKSKKEIEIKNQQLLLLLKLHHSMTLQIDTLMKKNLEQETMIISLKSAIPSVMDNESKSESNSNQEEKVISNELLSKEETSEQQTLSIETNLSKEGELQSPEVVEQQPISQEVQ